MADKHGDFVWYELMTPDPDAAQKFYGGLIGWKFEEGANPVAHLLRQMPLLVALQRFHQHRTVDPSWGHGTVSSTMAAVSRFGLKQASHGSKHSGLLHRSWGPGPTDGGHPPGRGCPPHRSQPQP